MKRIYEKYDKGMDSYLTHNGERKWDEIKFLKRLETTYNYINIYIVAVEQLKLK